MTRDQRDREHAEPEHVAHRARPRNARGDDAVVEDEIDAAEAWRQIDEILTQHAGGERLPGLARSLDATGKGQLVARMNDLRAFAGDIVWDTLLATGNSLAFAITFAPYGATPVSKERVRKHVARLRAAELTDLTGAAFVELRKFFPGKLADELPTLVRDLSSLTGNPDVVRWWLTTTEPKLAAHRLATVADAALAKTCDEAQLWGWLDDLDGASAYYGLPELWKSTSDPTAKAKLAAKLGPLATEDPEFAAESELHKPDVDAVVKRRGSAEELLDATALARGRGDASVADVLATLRRDHPTPTQAVQILATLTYEPIAVVVPPLLEVPGVTATHLLTLWANFGYSEQAAALRDDRLRAAIKKRLGPGVPLRALVDTAYVKAAELARDEALRRWWIADAAPADALWLVASGSPAECAAACRALRSDGAGLGWAKQLTAQENQEQLRVLANNCGDAATTAHLRESVIREWSWDPITAGQREDADVTGAARSRLDAAVHDPTADRVARLADLDDAERAALAHDPKAVSELTAHLDQDELIRALALLDLTVASAIRATPARGYHRGVVEYLRTRPAGEEAEVFEHADLIDRATGHVHPDPLLVLPSLRQPKRLAQAIALVPAVVERLLAGSDPSLALRLLDDPFVRPKAAPYLAGRPEALDALPRYEHLTARGQTAFDELGRAAGAQRGGDEVRDVVTEIADGSYEDGAAKAAARGATLDSARQQTTIDGAVAALDQGASETADAMALVHQFRDQIPALIADPGRWPTVDRLRALIGLLPTVAFPDLSPATLLRSVNTRRWMFEDAQGFLLLGYFAKDPGAAVLAAVALFDDEPGARAWLRRLPHAAGLTDREEDWLDKLASLVADPDVLRDLFNVRFGIAAPAQYASATLHTLYETLSRLPDGHLQQERIKQIVSTDAGVGTAGYWSEELKAIVIDDEMAPDKSTDETPERASWMTRAQVTERYGFDDAALAAQVAAGHVEERAFDEGTLYKIATVVQDKFTSTVLHEVGHAVDEILGKQTEVIYDRAGWRKYGIDQFETWAAEAGGWDKVAAKDRAPIRQAWVDSLFSRRAIKDLVPDDHPALAARYAGVGLVDDARADRKSDYHERNQHGDRVFVSQPHYQAFYSVPLRTSQVAPSDYSMYAPEEYFAECYVEYYREVDGTPEGQRKKGGALPVWIKQWFDQHVDRVRFDPKRMKP